jgi:hypothetical protein
MIARMLMLAGFSVPFISFAVAQDTYCAFEVTVRSPSGIPMSEVPVALIRGHKATFYETTTDANGVARVCDAPLENLDIIVGFDMCKSVMVRFLMPTWPDTQRISVTYVKTFCGFASFKPECIVTLRIQDDAGHPVIGALFNGNSTASSGSTVSDSFGRLFRSLKRRKSLRGVVIGKGFEPARISIKCEDDVEVRVALHKQ